MSFAAIRALSTVDDIRHLRCEEDPKLKKKKLKRAYKGDEDKEAAVQNAKNIEG